MSIQDKISNFRQCAQEVEAAHDELEQRQEDAQAEFDEAGYSELESIVSCYQGLDSANNCRSLITELEALELKIYKENNE